MSFQHFKGEKLYSDIVVKPENKMTETERVECYPVSDDAEENGREEGYYPDSSVVYIRTLWREFEPKRGEYNYAFIEDIINKAKGHGQQLVFRLMAHSTRACDDVPEWLKELIPCPERPDMMRVKDSPTDPLFVDLFLEAVKHLGARFDSEPTLWAVDISLPGAWGEGYKLELYPDDILVRMTEAYMAAFPTTQLFAQCIRPNIIDHVSKTRSIGWRGDGLGEPIHTFEEYPARIAKIEDKWRRGPVAFESYWWLMEWQRRGWDIDRIIQCTLDWHISSLNPKSMPIPYEWRDKVDAWVRKMGYHFVIDTVEMTERASNSLDFEIEIDNVGVAPIYTRVPLVLRLKNENYSVKLDTGADITSWFPGKHTVSVTLSIPEDIPRGKYSAALAITGEGYPDVYFASDAESDGCYFKVAELTLE